ncbi:acyltransferase family protein [Serratia grimesii]|uniref:acyltransferase family protein n=1 Tax=Serratia grimesii TaxID=82995 RepID=UPI0039AEA4DB
MSGISVGNIISRGNNNLDLIRLLAAISVIVYHSFPLNPQWGLTDPIKDTFSYMTTGGLAVKVFFFISGLLVTNSLLSRESTIHFVISRAFRIFPGLAFVLILTALVIGPIFTTMPFTDYFTSGQPLVYILKNLSLQTQYFLPGLFEGNKYGVNGSLWTIHYEVLAYVVLLGIYLLGIGKSQWLSSLVCICIIIEPITPLKGVLFASSDNNAIYLLAPCFALGSLLAINKDLYKSNITIPIVIFTSQFIFTNEAISSLLMCLSVCLALLHISSLEIVKKIRIRQDISYGVYLWGFPVQQVISQSFHFGFFANVLLSILLTMAIALVSWVAIEKPAINFAKLISIKGIHPSSVRNTHK